MFSIPEPTVSPARRQPWGTVEMITPAHGTAVTLELMVSDVPHKRFQAGSEKDPSNSTAFSWLQVWTHPGSSRQHWALTCQGWSAAPVLMGQEMALAQQTQGYILSKLGLALPSSPCGIYSIPPACCMHFS